MAEKVEVKGGGDFDGAIFKNAATEATLLRLVTILEAKQKGTGNKAQDLFTQALNKNIKAVDQSTDRQKAYSQELDEVREKTARLKNAFAEIAETTVSTVFSSIVSSGKLFASFLTDSFTAFQETNKVGASFNYDLLELRKTAAAAAMPLDDFTKFVVKNSKELAAFGGTVTEGAKAFAQFREEFTDPAVNKELYNLGFNTESLNKIMAEQLRTEMISGRSRDLNSSKFVSELKEYAKDLNKLSKITGISTQTLQEGVSQQLADGRMIFLQNKLTGKSLQNFREGLALMNAELDPKVFDTLKNMMSGVIDPADKFGAMLAIAAPGILEFQEALGAGSLNVEQQLRGYEQQVSQIGSFLQRFSKEQIARIPELKAMQEYLASIKKFTGDQGRANLEANKAMDGIIGLFSSFGEIINRAKNLFFESLVKSGTMDRLMKSFEKLFSILEDRIPKVIQKLQPVMEKAAGWIDKVVDSLIGFVDSFLSGDLKSENVWDWLKTTLSGAVKIIADGIGTVFSGLLGITPEQEAQREAYKKATPQEQEKMRKENPALAIPDVGNIFDKMGEGLKSLVDMVPSLSEFAAFFGVVAGGSVIAGMGIAAGMAAMATAMTELAIPALALGGAIGLGAGGLGYMFNGLANIIDKISGSFTNIETFFTGLKEVDPSKIVSLSLSLGSLSSAISQLKIVDPSNLDKIAESLTKLINLDLNQIGSISPLNNLIESFKNITSLNLGTKISEVISSLTGALFPLVQVDFEKLKNIQESLRVISGTVSNVGSIDVSNLVSIRGALVSVQDTIDVLLNVDFAKLSTSLLSAKGIFSKIGAIDAANLEKLSPTLLLLRESFSSFDQFASSIDAFNQIDTDQTNNIISGLNKIKTTVGDDFEQQSKGVDNFTNSVNKLIETLKILQDQMEKNTKLPESMAISVPGRTVTTTSPSENTNDLQKQLNNTLSELVTQITEVNQNTKELVDTVKGRNGAMR